MQRDNQDFSDICRARQAHVKLAGYVSCSYIARRATLVTRAHPSVADVHHAQCTNISTHGNASFAGGGRALCGWKRLLCGWGMCPLRMETPLRGRSGGHTGAAPTNLHHAPLPHNYLACLFIGNPSPATNLSCMFVHRRTISLAGVNAVGARVLRILRCSLCLLWQWLRGCLGQQSFRRQSHLRGRCR